MSPALISRIQYCVPTDLSVSYPRTLCGSVDLRHNSFSRDQLHKREVEIEELKRQLSLRLSPKPNASQTIDGLKKELQAVIERNKRGNNIIYYFHNAQNSFALSKEH